MQPAIINSKPGPTTNAAGELQLDIGEDDPPDSADKPASSHLSSAHRSSSLASTQTITPAIAILSLQTSNSNDGLRPTFCTGDSTPRAGFGAATPNGDGNGTVPLASCGIATTALSGTAPIAIDKYPHHQHHQHPPRSTATPSSLSTSAGTGTTMLGCASAGSSNSDSDSPASTMPPSSEQSSPPPSCPGSRPGSRKSSFSERANGTAHKPASINGSEGGGAHHSSGGGQRFTLKDLLASGPKVARKPSQSSRKSDTSSDRGGYAESTTTSLLKKYGVCEKIAIGKGATSVVRLAHKWDRSEEKLYAVKVCPPTLIPAGCLSRSSRNCSLIRARRTGRIAGQRLKKTQLTVYFCTYPPSPANRNSERGERTKQKRNTSKSSRPSFVSLLPCTIPTLSRRSTSSKMSSIIGAK
jgi:hypothetical protein